MRTRRVAQLNSTVGDFQGNLDLALDAYEQLVGRGAELVVYPELFPFRISTTGLTLRNSFIKGSRTSLQRIFGKNWTYARFDWISRRD